MLLIQDDVGELALEVDEVDGSRPDDLEREAIIAVPCIARLRPFHPRMVAQDGCRRQAGRWSAALDELHSIAV
jgi:hypothetical protein